MGSSEARFSMIRTRFFALCMGLVILPACGIQSLLVPLITDAIDKAINGGGQSGDVIPDDTAIGRAVDLEILMAGRVCCDPANGPDQVVTVVTVRHTGDSGSSDVEVKFVPEADSILSAQPVVGVISRGEEIDIEVYASDCNFDVQEFRVRTYFVGQEGKTNLSVTTLLRVTNICSPDRPVVAALERLTPDGPIDTDFINAVTIEELGEAVEHGNVAILDKVPNQPLSEISTWGRISANYSSSELSDMFTGGSPDFPLGNGANGWAYQGGISNSMSAGDYELVFVSFNGVFALTDTSRIWRFAVVADSDGQSDNNYVPPLAELNDPVKGTDSWYSLVHLPGNGWSFHLYLADGSEVATSARVVLDGNALVFVIPKSEVNGPGAGFRITTFTHKGDFGANGDWSGDFHPKPPVLAPIPD
jgi:hypothetical protein